MRLRQSAATVLSVGPKDDFTMRILPLMSRPGLIHRYWPRTPSSFLQLAPWKRSARTAAFESSLDPADLSEARNWRQSLNEDSLPKGTTTFARSGGPGGQHVNKSVHHPDRPFAHVDLRLTATNIEQRPRPLLLGPFPSSFGSRPSLYILFSVHPTTT